MSCLPLQLNYHFSLIRVTILRDKETRESKGVAFVLFLDRQMAQKAVAAVNKKQVFTGSDKIFWVVGGWWELVLHFGYLGGSVANF